MNVVNQYGDKKNGFAEVAAFCHITCSYFDRFLLQGIDTNWCQACFFYLALGLICEGYWQVNSQKLIFCIADPIYDAAFSQQVTSLKSADFSKINQLLYSTTILACGNRR